MVAELSHFRPVFDVVGRPTSTGSTWVWAREDLDRAAVDRARIQLGGLVTGDPTPRRVLVYLGADRFVDLRGLRLLLDVATEVRRRDGALAVVAPPHCLTEMVSLLDLEEDLPMVASVRLAAAWARSRAGGRR